MSPVGRLHPQKLLEVDVTCERKNGASSTLLRVDHTRLTGKDRR
jgi:hypothetical protein